LTIFVVAISSAVAFAMGGPAPEEGATPGPTSTAEVQAVAPTTESAGGGVEQAKEELASLEAQREKIDNYLEALNKKIIKAKIAKDAKKISELQATEHDVSEYDNKIAQKISAIKEKYPELNTAENAGMETQAAGQVQEKFQPQIAAGHNIVYHDVVMGDTLMNISRKYFGTPVYYKDIAKMNNLDPHGSLSQGSSLKIDLNMGGGKVGSIETNKKAAPKPVAGLKPVAGGIVYHVVAKGDTLMSISREYFNGSASFYKEIAEMNGITGSGLKIGMKLKIDTGLKKTAKPAL
jgi:nucleoid-associated protein YgaU